MGSDFFFFFENLVDRATNTRVDSCGRTLYGHNGGVWEWTSTDFEGLPGFETSEVYPGYSTDFFDGLHKVVVSRPHSSTSTTRFPLKRNR